MVSALRFPLALAFVLVGNGSWRLVILAAAAASDLFDGWLARRFGGSRLGTFIDPVADKLFMATAFGVVVLQGGLGVFEVLAVLLRDLVATVAFVATWVFHRPSAIPARLGGKMVTVGQLLTLLAFLVESSLVQPMAWATGGIGIYAIGDYVRVARATKRRVGT